MIPLPRWPWLIVGLGMAACSRSPRQYTVEEMLSRVDRHLAYETSPQGSDGGCALGVSWQGGDEPDSARVDTLGVVRTGADGVRDPIEWSPACGPWDLKYLMSFELGLFSRPWSETFGDSAWTEKTIKPVPGGWTLRFVPVDSLGGPAALNAPVVRGFQVWVDSTEVPRQALCELDMQLFAARGYLEFEYEHAGGGLRIRRITHQIEMGTVRIHPRVDLLYRDGGGERRLTGADFAIPGAELSSLFAGYAFHTHLRLQVCPPD